MNTTNSKDKIQSIGHGKWAIDKLNELCKAYSYSTKYIKSRKGNLSPKLLKERLINSRLCVKKNRVTNISLIKSQTNKVNNRNISSNSERDLSDAIYLSAQTQMNKINDDEEEARLMINNYVLKKFSDKAKRTSLLIRRNELSENRCTSASTSTYLKRKLNQEPIAQHFTKHSFRRHDVGGLYSSFESKIAIVSQNKTETSQEIKPQIEHQEIIKKKPSQSQIKEKHNNHNEKTKLLSIILSRPNGFSKNIIQNNNIQNMKLQLEKRQMAKLASNLNILKSVNTTKNTISINRIIKSSEKLKSILMTSNKKNTAKEIDNTYKEPHSRIENPHYNIVKNNIVNKHDSHTKKFNKLLLKTEDHDTQVPKEVNINNEFNNQRRTENKTNQLLQLRINDYISAKNLVKRKLIKSNTITCKSKKKHKTKNSKEKNFLQDLLIEVEQLQIEKRQIERLTEFPSNPENNFIQEKAIIINKPLFFDSEGKNNNTVGPQSKNDKFNTPSINDNQMDMFTFNTLKHDIQDTVPISRVSQTDKKETISEKNIDHTSLDHSLTIPSIIAKNKKAFIFFKNYKSQLSKISEFSHNKVTTKVDNSFSSAHCSAKSIENGELEPTSPINSMEMTRKAFALTHRNSLFVQRATKKNKTEIKEESELYREIYDSSDSDKRNNVNTFSKSNNSYIRRNSLKSENFIGNHYSSFTILSQSNLVKQMNNENEMQPISAASLLYFFKEIEPKTNIIEHKRNQLKLAFIENINNQYHQKELVKSELSEKDISQNFDVKEHLSESLLKENNEDILIMKGNYIYENHDLSSNSFFYINYLCKNYFDVDVAHKILVEHYFKKDFDIIELPTLSFNFNTAIDPNHYFKKRKTNIIQKEEPLLIQLNLKCMNFFNTFLIYDNPDNKDVIHNCIKKNSDGKRLFSPLIKRNSLANSNNPFFRIRNQNRKDTLDKNNMYSQKRFKVHQTKKCKKSQIQIIEKINDSILTRHFFKRVKSNVSYEYEESDNLLTLIEQKKTRLLDDPSLMLNKQNKKTKIYHEKYEDKSVFNKNNTLGKTNKIKGKILDSLKSHYDTLFFYIKDRNYPQFKETYEKYLIETEIKDQDGNSFLSLAVQCNCFQIVNFLLNLGADPNNLNKNNNTPLHYALTFHYFEIADMLIKRGANEAIQNKRGLTPWQCLDSAISIV